MSLKGVDTANLTFVFLLCQLCRLFDKELGVFDSFELSLQYCATVDCSTSMLVDLLGCSGHWQEVEDLINPMFCDLPDDAVWMELLGRCSPSCVMWWWENVLSKLLLNWILEMLQAMCYFKILWWWQWWWCCCWQVGSHYKSSVTVEGVGGNISQVTSVLKWIMRSR